jgi:hypothetical protein
LLAIDSISPALFTLVAVVALTTVISPAPDVGLILYKVPALYPLGVVTKLASSNKAIS